MESFDNATNLMEISEKKSVGECANIYYVLLTYATLNPKLENWVSYIESTFSLSLN